MSLITELKRRKVFRVAAVYLATAFAVLEGADLLIAGLGLPEGALRWLMLAAAVGLPVSLALSWFLEVTPEGIRVTPDRETAEGQVGMAEAADHSVLDARTGLVVGVLVIFGLGLGTGWLLGPSLDAAPDDGRPSIAVLPFENRSSDDDAVFFVDGMHDEVLTQLSKIAALRVIARASVMHYREDPRPLRQVGKELGVGTVLVGGVQRAGDQVRISVQLVDAATDTQVWAESYEQRLSPENLFAIQSDVSYQIAMSLDAELSAAEEAELADIPTSNQQAYDLYLRGNASYARQAVVQDFADAASLYEDALALDPEFAVAWANLSRAYSAMYHFHADRTPERLALARAAVDRAFELDPNLPEAHRALGWHLYRGYRDYGAALASLRRAEAVRPNDLDVMLAVGTIAKRQGDLSTSVRVSERVIGLNPIDPNPMGNLALLLADARDYEGAAYWSERVLAIDPDDEQVRILLASIPLWRDGSPADLARAVQAMEGWPDPLGIIAIERWRTAYHSNDPGAGITAVEGEGAALAYQTYYYPRALLQGLARRATGDMDGALADFEDARRVLERALADSPDEPRMLAALGLTLAGLGEREAALEAGRRAVEVAPVSLDAIDGPHYILELARTRALLADVEGAIEELAVYLDGFGAWSLNGILSDPVFAALPTHPRFAEISDGENPQ